MEDLNRLNEERMRDIADEKGNVVYEYVYDRPGREADVSQTMKFAKMIIQERASLGTCVSNDEARKIILENNSLLADFAADHAKTFEMMTDPLQSSQSYKMLCRMASFKQQSDSLGFPSQMQPHK